MIKKKLVTENVHLLVILNAKAKAEKEMCFLKLGKQNTAFKVHSAKSFEIDYPGNAKLIAFSYAFTGCDTVPGF